MGAEALLPLGQTVLLLTHSPSQQPPCTAFVITVPKHLVEAALCFCSCQGIQPAVGEEAE